MPTTLAPARGKTRGTLDAVIRATTLAPVEGTLAIILARHAAVEDQVVEIDIAMVFVATEELNDLTHGLTFLEEAFGVLADVSVEHLLHIAAETIEFLLDVVTRGEHLLNTGDLAGHNERNLDLSCFHIFLGPYRGGLESLGFLR